MVVNNSSKDHCLEVNRLNPSREGHCLEVNLNNSKVHSLEDNSQHRLDHSLEPHQQHPDSANNLLRRDHCSADNKLPKLALCLVLNPPKQGHHCLEINSNLPKLAHCSANLPKPVKQALFSEDNPNSSKVHCLEDNLLRLDRSLEDNSNREEASLEHLNKTQEVHFLEDNNNKEDLYSVQLSPPLKPKTQVSSAT